MLPAHWWLDNIIRQLKLKLWLIYFGKKSQLTVIVLYEIVLLGYIDNTIIIKLSRIKFYALCLTGMFAYTLEKSTARIPPVPGN